MAKRFTETGKWDDPWFRKLPPKLKCVWNYLCDRCDAAGVIDPDYQDMTFKVGERVTEKDMKAFDGRISVLAGGKLFLVKFIQFQYGELSEASKPHAAVLSILRRHGIEYGEISKGYGKGIDTLQEKDKEKETEKAEETDGGSGEGGEPPAPVVTAEQIYAAYPKKVGKPDAIPKIEKAMQNPPLGQDAAAWPETLLRITQRFADMRRGEDPNFTPHPSTWFHQARYNDDPETWQQNRPPPNGKQPILAGMKDDIDKWNRKP